MNSDFTALKAQLDALCDPEIPVLTLNDLGVIRNVELDSGEVVVTMTPTYSGCPAMDAMTQAVRQVLAASPFEGQVKTVFNPPWTTDWLSDAGREKLKQYGIAPPMGSASNGTDERQVACPRCDSTNTRVISQFGSTACKALHQCQSCLEPFDYFKCH
ncbi:MAG: 1,2-phenylacetyl-CoA epoxidase subunit PaaD [Lysobacterales bacterium]